MFGPDRAQKNRRRARKPVLERIEGRQLLSGIMATMATSTAQVAMARRPLRSAAAGSATTSAYADNTDGIPRFVNPTGTPTRATRAQAAFAAGFGGPYQLGPGRTSTESSTLYLQGAGGSNQFLHGTIQLRYAVPKDRSLKAAGVVTMLDRNINNSGQLGLDVTATTNADRRGRVRKFSWTVNTNYSSGIYANAVGQGTLVVRYNAAGVSTVQVRGQVLTQGVGDPTATASLDA